MTDPPDLRRGASGEAVRDLQQRLGALGHALPDDELGRFGEATEAAVRAFQEHRGVRVDGICGPETWASLVESGFRLGDRLLYHRQPMLRGDDVAELQRRLNALGFDADREDGILGEQTAGALREFQRNAGVAVDGICGPATVAALHRLGSLAAGSVASVRERESLRHPHGLAGRRVFLAAAPGFEPIGAEVARGLTAAGADTVYDHSGGDDSRLAAEANRFGADLCLALRAGDGPGCRCCYFASGSFRSETGHRVAGAVLEELASYVTPTQVAGHAYRLLRETRMAAVVCELARAGDATAMARLVEHSGTVAQAIVTGVRRAVEEPLPDDLTP
ncbi:MAG: peptidoglycan-binding protein [Acidimicrobiia bacterium]|nr:peptidoglycan-binding protein [Acidimicrobiia bacterium]